MRYISYAASHVGRVREKNEDAFFRSDELGLYIVADGMGGHPQGEVASRCAVDTLAGYVAERRSEPLDALVADGMLAANAEVDRRNDAESIRSRMGTTLSVVMLRERDFVAGNVGDSPLYLIPIEANAPLQQLSREDTLAATLILKGLPPSMITGSQSNTLTQAIGLGKEVSPHIVRGSLRRGEGILMCTDGVTNYVDQQTIRDAIRTYRHAPRKLVEALIASALDGGGGDNCTCLYVSDID